MSLYWENKDSSQRLFHGDAQNILFDSTPKSIQCVVTSPPYWGLRDYELGTKALGLESTPELYVQHLVEIFREVKRVLRDDGTLWLNLGDSYAGSWVAQSRPNGNDVGSTLEGGSMLSARQIEAHPTGRTQLKNTPGFKPKDLIGIPWRVAFALQADGWFLRSDIIWSKPNPMPESVRDRPTKAHEYLFLLTKSPRYYYDADAIREPTANKRTVWKIAAQPYKGAHFAVFPEKLVEPCILAGTSEYGACSTCGTPFVRILDVTKMKIRRSSRAEEMGKHGKTQSSGTMLEPAKHVTRGWKHGCEHDTSSPVPCIVLDPFAGSGTTLSVAQALNRRGIGIDASLDYLDLAIKRIEKGTTKTANKA